MRDPLNKVMGPGTMSTGDALFILLLCQYSNIKTTKQWQWAVDFYWEATPEYFNMLLESAE